MSSSSAKACILFSGSMCPTSTCCFRTPLCDASLDSSLTTPSYYAPYALLICPRVKFSHFFRPPNGDTLDSPFSTLPYDASPIPLIASREQFSNFFRPFMRCTIGQPFDHYFILWISCPLFPQFSTRSTFLTFPDSLLWYIFGLLTSLLYYATTVPLFPICTQGFFSYLSPHPLD